MLAFKSFVTVFAAHLVTIAALVLFKLGLYENITNWYFLLVSWSNFTVALCVVFSWLLIWRYGKHSAVRARRLAYNQYCLSKRKSKVNAVDEALDYFTFGWCIFNPELHIFAGSIVALKVSGFIRYLVVDWTLNKYPSLVQQ